MSTTHEGSPGKRAWALAILMLLTAAITFAGCGGGSEECRGCHLPTVRHGSLTVGVDVPRPPFAYGHPPAFRGFDVTVARTVADQLDLRLRLVDLPLEKAIQELRDGKLDMVASALPIAGGLGRIVAFSQPYFNVDRALIAARGTGIHSIDQLHGRTIGVTSRDEAEARRAAPDVKRVQVFGTLDEAVSALRAGHIAGVIGDFARARYLERSQHGVRVVETIPGSGRYGLAFAKRANAIRQAVDGEITNMKEEGTYDRIFRHWFRSDPPASALAVE